MSRHIVADVLRHHTVARMGFEPMTFSLKGRVGSSGPVRTSPLVARFDGFDSTAVRA